MSWLRSAVNRAVEVGGGRNITRTVRSYADSVVTQAVAGGTKLLQDRIAARHFQSFKLAVKRLEEVSVSCTGIERVQLLRRWLVALKELERHTEVRNSEYLNRSSERNDSPLEPTVVLYYDPDLRGEPMNFHDVFLHSQALEGIIMSLILEEPNEEELCLLMEIFRLCLMGGKEVLDAILTNVQDLASAFSTYNEEVLAKREELLQYAQDAIAGLKVNAEIVRIDSEISSTHKKLEGRESQLPLKESSMKTSGFSAENLKEALAFIELCSQLEELLLRKKAIKEGDSPEAHNEKVDKLKILSESLAGSASKAEKRISEIRVQKEEALKFRVVKTSEVSQLEKDGTVNACPISRKVYSEYAMLASPELLSNGLLQEFAAEIKALEKRKEDLEEELRKVSTALTSAHARLRNTREERDQFDEASNQIIQHFKLKDDELSKSIALYRAEAKVCSTFVDFLESSWVFQTSNAKQKEKLVKDDLERHEEYFVNLAASLLGACKEELGRGIPSTLQILEHLKSLDELQATDEESEANVNPRKTLAEQYLDTLSKIETTFNVVESIKKQFCTRQPKYAGKSDGEVKELLDELEKMKADVESIEKPTLELEATCTQEEILLKRLTPRIPFLSPRLPPAKEKLETNPASTSTNEAQRGMSLPFPHMITLPLVRSRSTGVPESGQLEHMDVINGPKSSDAEAQFSKLKLELELENHSRGSSMDGLIEWEFDEEVEKPRKNL